MICGDDYNNVKKKIGIFIIFFFWDALKVIVVLIFK